MKKSNYSLADSSLPRGLRLAIVSDLHAQSSRRAIDALREIKPTHILMAGDILEALEWMYENMYGEAEIEEIVNFYDYLEIQPISNNRFLIDEGTVKTDDDLRDLNRQIVELGERYRKPVVATCDVHYLNPDDEIGRNYKYDIEEILP